MDFLDPCGIASVCLVPPRGAEPLSVCLVNRHERGLFQDDVRARTKKRAGAGVVKHDLTIIETMP